MCQALDIHALGFLQEIIRASNGIKKLVALLSAGSEADCTHRALLALRILTNSEADRLVILKVALL